MRIPRSNDFQRRNRKMRMSQIPEKRTVSQDGCFQDGWHELLSISAALKARRKHELYRDRGAWEGAYPFTVQPFGLDFY